MTLKLRLAAYHCRCGAERPLGGAGVWGEAMEPEGGITPHSQAIHPWQQTRETEIC